MGGVLDEDIPLAHRFDDPEAVPHADGGCHFSALSKEEPHTAT
jgi:hypothetical protein